MWYVYMIRCKNAALYTGITTSLARRYQEHLDGTGSKSVKAAGGPLRFEITIPVVDQSVALKLEAAIKRLSKSSKEKLATTARIDDFPSLKKYFHRPLTEPVQLRTLDGT